jgi:WD40 repeat protein
MTIGQFLTGLGAPFGLIVTAAIGWSAPLPVLDDKPVLQVDANGPSSAVTALAFSVDGKTLYSAGLDKAVRVWTLRGDKFILSKTIRVPIGPGTGGAINALAVSPDGAWLAVAGRAPMRGETGFQRTGVILEAATFRPEQLEDAGLIYLFPNSGTGAGTVLRGHRGEVRALAFAPARADKPTLLASTANEREGARTHGDVRLWNVDTGKVLAERSDLPSRVEPPPGLTVWHTGNRPEEVRVAVGWPEENDKEKVQLRIWKPELRTNESMETIPADRYTRPLAMLEQSGTTRLLAGGLGTKQGVLKAWEIDKKAPPDTVAEFAPRGAVHFVPDAIATASARADGTTTHTIVLLRPTADEDNQLAVVDLAKQQVIYQIPLTASDRVHLPILAATERGRFVALADSADHSIRVFAVADLLQGKAAPSQILGSNGLTPRRVAFVDKGHGLWLSEDSKAKPLGDGIHFDFDKGKLQSVKAGMLASDSPELGDWAIERDGKSVHARKGNKVFPAVPIKANEVITAAALRPEKSSEPALLAVAITDRDNSRTLILLCRPDDGVPFRLLIGHLQDVRSLAFSASRALLASVAEDQTVCVWSLTDLDKPVGQLAGLGVADKDGKAVVHYIAVGSAAARAGLAVNDIVESIGSAGGERRPITSAADFLLAVSSRRPDDRVDLTIQGKKKPITLAIERGVGGWKPLFSLFLLRNENPTEWIGWSPAGPYDASSDTAEACVGWHTNTGNAAAPVEFVRAGEHREEYYRHGILGLLADELDLARALKRDEARRKPPEPALQLRRPERAEFTNQDDVFVVRSAIPSLRVGINADYPLTKSHVLTWRVQRADGDKVTATDVEVTGAARLAVNEWETDLTPVQWRRGDYLVSFSLSPNVGANSVATKSVTLRFQSPAPTLSLLIAGKEISATEKSPLTVMEDKLSLELKLGAASGEKVNVSIAQWVNGREQESSKPLLVEPGKLTQPISLGKGVNRIIVRAVNAAALANHETEESITAPAVWVRYDVPNELPPRFTALKLERSVELKQVAKKDVWIVDQPRIRLNVGIEADGALVQADWSAGSAEAKSILPEKDPGKSLECHVDLDLPPGEVVPVRLRAKSKNSELNSAELRVAYYPPLPILTLNALPSPDFLTPTTTLSGAFRVSTTDLFDLTVRVSSEQGSTKDAKEFKARIDPEKKTWNADVALLPGRNRVEAFVRNKWRGEEALPAVKLSLAYRRLPRIVDAKEVTAVETAVVDLPLTVESPTGMLIRGITIEGQRYSTFKAIAGKETDGWVAWQVVVPNVPVCEEGRKLEQLHVLAHNDDGPREKETVGKDTLVKVVHKVLPKAADARFLLPKEVNEHRLKCAIPYRVDSDSPLVSVVIRRGDEILHTADLTKVKKEGTRFVLEEKPDLALNVGLNNLNLIALNAGGRSGGAVVVNVLQPSVRVLVDRIELRPETGGVKETAKPLPGVSDELRFPKLSGSLAWVVGRVVWSDPDAAQLDAKDLNIVVLVRGCRQFPAALEARGTGVDNATRQFAVPVVLTDTENTIKIEVKENRTEGDKTVGQDVLSRNTFKLECATPATQQRLHLLVVGVNVADGAALANRVLDTLGASERPNGLQGEFKTAAFEKSILYRVLIGEVERGKVEAQLMEINKEIRRLHTQSKWLNDVILVYYQGEDVVKDGERWLKTSRNVQYPDVDAETYAIPCRSLPREAGTPLLLLNVIGGAETTAQGPGKDEPAIGMLRYAWNDKREPQNAELLLTLFGKAIREKSRLGEVAAYVNDLIGQQPKKLIGLIVLNPDQADRKVGAAH